MSFARANSIGWALYEVLTSAQMNALDIDHTKAIDGVAGGTYAPSSPITLTTGAVRLAPGVGTVEWSANALPLLTSREVVRSQPVDIVSDHSMSTYNSPSLDWSYASSSPLQNYVDTGLTPNIPHFYHSLIPAIQYGTLTKVDMFFKPNGGHPGTAITAPKFQLIRNPGSSSLGTSTGTIVDVPTYEAGYTSTLSGLSESISPTNGYRYSVKVSGEAGPSAVALLEVILVRMYYTVNTIHP